MENRHHILSGLIGICALFSGCNPVATDTTRQNALPTPTAENEPANTVGMLSQAHWEPDTSAAAIALLGTYWKTLHRDSLAFVFRVKAATYQDRLDILDHAGLSLGITLLADFRIDDPGELLDTVYLPLSDYPLLRDKQAYQVKFSFIREDLLTHSTVTPIYLDLDVPQVRKIRLQRIPFAPGTSWSLHERRASFQAGMQRWASQIRYEILDTAAADGACIGCLRITTRMRTIDTVFQYWPFPRGEVVEFEKIRKGLDHPPASMNIVSDIQSRDTVTSKSLPRSELYWYLDSIDVGSVAWAGGRKAAAKGYGASFETGHTWLWVDGIGMLNELTEGGRVPGFSESFLTEWMHEPVESGSVLQTFAPAH
jgi:hypothetical protein